MVEWILYLGNICAALTAIGALCLSIYITARKPWKAGKRLLDQFTAMSFALGENGGSSLADSVRRQEQAQKAHGKALQLLAAVVAAMPDLFERPVFQTDDKGQWVRANRTFGQTFGYPVADMLGNGWVSIIDDAERDTFMNAWHYAIDDKREFRRQAHVATRSGALLLVTVVAHPTVGNPEVGVIGWLGQISIVAVKREAPAAEQVPS